MQLVRTIRQLFLCDAAVEGLQPATLQLPTESDTVTVPVLWLAMIAAAPVITLTLQPERHSSATDSPR